MIELATISFRDLETLSDAVVVLRRSEKGIHICLSVASNGDVEVAMNKIAAHELLQALRQAVDGLGL